MAVLALCGQAGDTLVEVSARRHPAGDTVGPHGQFCTTSAGPGLDTLVKPCNGRPANPRARLPAPRQFAADARGSPGQSWNVRATFQITP